MTDLALATSIDPKFPELAKELVFMGGSLRPETTNPEFVNSPRHEFNFWFDPEAADRVLRAGWKKIVCTPTDISVKTRLTREMVQQIEKSGTPLAKYVARYFQPGIGSDYMWDELAAAAWIDARRSRNSTNRSASLARCGSKATADRRLGMTSPIPPECSSLAEEAVKLWPSSLCHR